MQTSARHRWSRSLGRLLAAAVLVAIILGPGGSASAVAVSPTSGFDAHEHGLYCGCGDECRRKACCCGPEDAKPRSGSPVPTGAGPCMNSAPCGVPMPPNAPPAGVGDKVASLPPWASATMAGARRLLPLSMRCILPPRRATRLDDPPERPDVA